MESLSKVFARKAEVQRKVAHEAELILQLRLRRGKAMFIGFVDFKKGFESLSERVLQNFVRQLRIWINRWNWCQSYMNTKKENKVSVVDLKSSNTEEG